MSTPPRPDRSRQALDVDHLMGDIGRRAASGGAIAVAAQIVKLLIQFGTLAVMARLLRPADFGLVAMATTVTLFVGLFTDFGLSAATVQRREIGHGTVSALFYINVATGIALMLLAIGAAPLAAWGFGDPRVSPVVTALAVQIPFVAATAQHNALLRRGMRWITLHATGIGAQFAGATVAIMLAWQTGLGYWALVAQSWTVALVDLVLVWTLCPWRPGRVDNWQDARSAVGFGLHLTGFNFINYFHRQFDDVLIGWRWGAADLGYYTRAYQLLLLPLALVNNPVSSAVIPALSRLQGEPVRWRATFLDALALVTLISAGMTAVLLATARPLVTVIFGHGWGQAADIFMLLAISMFAAAPMNAMGWIYISLGRTDRMFKWGLLSTPLTAASFVVGLPFGADGVALAYSTMICLLLLPCLLFASRTAPVNLSDMLKTLYAPTALSVSCAIAGRYLVPAGGGSAALEVLSHGAIAGGLYLLGAGGLLMFHSRFSQLRQQAHIWLASDQSAETT